MRVGWSDKVVEIMCQADMASTGGGPRSVGVAIVSTTRRPRVAAVSMIERSKSWERQRIIVGITAT